jgi:tetratricopeptide (TPR) repeat protein
MNIALPQAYLLGLIGLLSIVAVVVARQVWRVRRQEGQLSDLEQRCQASDADAASLYELGSVQLDKRLFAQAAASLKRAAKLAGAEPAEAQALIENALGFSLAAQQKHSEAVRHYRLALKARQDYPVALNNLAFSLEKQQKGDEAVELYRKALELEPGNRTATRRLKLLRPES